MQIAKVSRNKVTEIGDYRQLFPSTAFPSSGITAEFMQENGCLGVTVFKAHDRATQKLVSCKPYIEDGQVFTVEVQDKTQEEIAADTASKSAQIRSHRASMLAACDWTQMPDCNIAKKAEWATYRQALRDLTNQSGFPDSVTWPKDPNFVELEGSEE